MRYVVVQGSGARLQPWLSESRDVAQDFLTLFGDELPARSDNTQARSSGWVAQL
jgi:hypothetical protein